VLFSPRVLESALLLYVAWFCGVEIDDEPEVGGGADGALLEIGTSASVFSNVQIQPTDLLLLRGEDWTPFSVVMIADAFPA